VNKQLTNLKPGAMTKITKVNFDGEQIYCGIDVHKLSWRVNIRSEEFELEDYSQQAEEEALLSHLRKNYPGAAYELVYEAGFSGFSLQRSLASKGIKCLVINAADVPSSDKDKRRKSDCIDARKLSKALGKGLLKGVFVPQPEMEHIRTLVRQRDRLVQDQIRCKSRIKHLLLFSGLKVEEDSCWSGRYIKRLEELDCGDIPLRQALDLALQEYQAIRKLTLQATRHLRMLSQQQPYAKIVSLLRSIPGIGLINAMTILSEIQEMTRFKTLDKLCGYAGIVPDLHGSGEEKNVRGITRRSNCYLREAIVESSWSIIRKDPVMLMSYKQYCKKMHPNKAIIKIARHLLSRIQYVWLKEVPYQKGRIDF
jgi:transposase